MITLKSHYLGDLRTVSAHLRSGSELTTDAPVDNNGKGQTFSPTDLVAAALGSCMITVMGIHAAKMGLSLGPLSWETTKIMASNPRKISKLVINIFGSDIQASSQELDTLKEIAIHCPVALSLHPDLEQEVVFHF